MARRLAPRAQVGIAHLLCRTSARPRRPEPTATPPGGWTGYENRWFLDPVLRGSYPADMLDWYGRQVPLGFIRDGDLPVIAAATDFMGVNYYETKIVAAGPAEPYHQARVLPQAGR